MERAEIIDDGDTGPAVRGLFRLPKPESVPSAWRREAVKAAIWGMVGALVASLVWLVVLRGIEDSLRPSWARKVVN